MRRQCDLIGLPRAQYYCARGRRDAREPRADAVDRQAVPAHTVLCLPADDALAPAPGPHTSRPLPVHAVYPYRLRGLAIEHSCQVWCADITYIPMRRGFMYLMAVLDWFSRYVVPWRLSKTLDTGFCVEALDAALETGQPLIFNTDQGAQFTSTEWIERLKAWDILISMDGRGRALDNVFVE